MTLQTALHRSPLPYSTVAQQMSWADGNLPHSQRVAVRVVQRLHDADDAEFAGLDVSTWSASDRMTLFAVAVWVANADGREAPEEVDFLLRLRAQLELEPIIARRVHHFVRRARRSARRLPNPYELDAILVALRRSAHRVLGEVA